MTYVEFPFDRIIELHVKKEGEPPDGGDGGPVTGPCGAATILVFGFEYKLYFTERRTSYGGFGGTYLMPQFCCPPLPWYYDAATQTWPPSSQNSWWVPGNGATSVTITMSGPHYPVPPVGTPPPGNFAVWIYPTKHPYTGWDTVPGPDVKPPDITAPWPGVISATVNALAPAGAPDGLLGTTVVFNVLFGGAAADPIPASRAGVPGTGDVPYYRFDIEHHGCPAGAPPTSPGHPLSASGRGYPINLSPRCSES